MSVVFCTGLSASWGTCRRRMRFFFSSRRRHTRLQGDWSSDVALPIFSSGPSNKVTVSSRKNEFTAIVEENSFFLEDTVTLLLGPDETVQGAVADVGGHFLEDTAAYWREWVRSLAIPFEWQDAVIRAAITLKLNVFEDTGAIIAAVTTSIPEAPGSGRNWDYRYCWLRDAYFVINALNRLSDTQTMERYLS